jgi:glucuronate isomerase
MLYSQGIRLEQLGVARRDGDPVEADGRRIWRLFAENFYLFAGTPSRLWFEHSLETVFGIAERLGPGNADALYDRISDALQTEELRPRALYRKFNIEVIATTDSALDDLASHDAIRASGWDGRVVPTYRPDAVVNPDSAGFADNVKKLVEMTGNALDWNGYLAAHRARRAYFRERGATATDHGHPSARTADLSQPAAALLFERILSAEHSAEDAEIFRAQMLTEMARMSIDDGLVMQIHPGSYRNHNPSRSPPSGLTWVPISRSRPIMCGR